MSARDIAYVVHAILKPVLAEVITEDDYFIQFVNRRIGGRQGNPVNPKKPRDMDSEMMSREKKNKEWASEKSTLGHVAKSNVARPRALIATPQSKPSEQDNEQQKQRAHDLALCRSRRGGKQATTSVELFRQTTLQPRFHHQPVVRQTSL